MLLAHEVKIPHLSEPHVDSSQKFKLNTYFSLDDREERLQLPEVDNDELKAIVIGQPEVSTTKFLKSQL